MCMWLKKGWSTVDHPGHRQSQLGFFDDPGQYLHKNWTLGSYSLYIKQYEKRLLPRCIHHFKSNLMNNMDHMRISGNEPSSVILCQIQGFQTLKKLPESAKTRCLHKTKKCLHKTSFIIKQYTQSSCITINWWQGTSQHISRPFDTDANNPYFDACKQTKYKLMDAINFFLKLSTSPWVNQRKSNEKWIKYMRRRYVKGWFGAVIVAPSTKRAGFIISSLFSMLYHVIWCTLWRRYHVVSESCVTYNVYPDPLLNCGPKQCKHGHMFPDFIGAPDILIYHSTDWYIFVRLSVTGWRIFNTMLKKRVTVSSAHMV